MRRKEGDSANSDLVVNDALDNADKTYDFYRHVLGRHCVDGSGKVFQPGALARDLATKLGTNSNFADAAAATVASAQALFGAEVANTVRSSDVGVN